MTTALLDRPPEPIDDITRRDLFKGVGALGAGWILAGCSRDGDDADREGAGDTRTVVDASGAEVEIPADPQRIAVAAERIVGELLAAIGREPVAAASTDEYPDFVADQLGGLADVADVGPQHEVNLEALAAADPDLIIVQAVANFGDPELLAAARRIAPTVQLDAYANARAVIDGFAAVFGESVAAELHTQLDAAVKRIAAAVDDPARVEVSSIHLRPDTFEVLTLDPSRLHALLLQEAGFAIPAAQRDLPLDNELSLERLAIADADVLFMVGFFGDSDAQLERIYSSPLWQRLDAVSRDAVIAGDFRYWNSGGPLSARRVADDIVAGFQRIGVPRTQP